MNTSRRMAAAVALLFVSAAALPVTAAPLRAAATRVDITPPTGLAMYGFANRKGGAAGVLDPLMARVLVLQAGPTTIALVVLDLGEPLASGWIERLQSDAARTGVGHVVVAATHTHSGPDIRPTYPPSTPPDWESGVLAKVSRAIDDASHRLVDARLGMAYGRVLIGHNRLRQEPNGAITWFERNNTMVPTSPVDPTVAVLRIDTLDGQPIAVVVNHACHPVVFGSDNLQYSADYPGVAMRVVEQELGGEPTAMFLQGGDGDINPYFAVHPIDEDAVHMRDWTGERLGREAARVAKGIKTEGTAQASLDVAEDVIDLQPRWAKDKFLPAVRRSWGEDAAAAIETRYATGLRAPVTTLLVNKTVALMTMPGEPFVEHQIDWRSRCPVPGAFFVGYANDSLGYFPTIRAAVLGGYGAANTATYVQPDAGARLVDHAIVRVYEMLGRLKDSPEDAR